MNPDELMEEHGNVPAAPVETTTMETVIQKRSRRPETERNAKWLPTVLMWTFPILIIVVIYLYASSNMNKADPKNAAPENLTNEQKDPSKNQPSPTAVGAEWCLLRNQQAALKRLQRLLWLRRLHRFLHQALRRLRSHRTVNRAKRRFTKFLLLPEALCRLRLRQPV